VYLAGGAGMALLAAAVDAALPASRRSWWHARPRQAFAPRHEHAAALTTSAADVAEVGSMAPVPALQLVGTVERRDNQLPFVGRDRRRAARAAARQRRAANDR
jgi:hypothetical protein